MRAGSLIDDRFEVEDEAARGGTGIVYRARDLTSDAAVAVKLLTTASRRVVNRFNREAGVLSQLRHPGIVRYIQHGTEAGRPYMAMEWLEGQDLRARLDGAGLEPGEAFELGVRLASALGHAHRLGIVHRDVKPANVVLPGGRAEEAKLVDFGIAKAALLTRRPTHEDAFVGTPGYMAPEQARGAEKVEPTADVFSLGCVLFECFARRPAFAAEHVMALLAKILFEDAPALTEIEPTLAPALSTVIARMLEKDPGARHADGAAAAAALARVRKPIAGVPSLRPPAESRPSLGEQERRLLSVVVAGTLGDVAHLDVESPEEPAPPIREIADRFGGRLERLADGSLVVTLRGTGAAQDQAASAARVGLALREALPDSPVAIATGRGDLAGGLPVGEVIDRAARNLFRASSAAGRDVRLDELTAGLLGRAFELRDEGDARFLVGDAEGRTAETRGLPFVGRMRELRTIEAVAEQCVEESSAHAVLVLGPAGVGKTRLADEALAALHERHPTLRAVVARGNPVGVGGTFGLLAGLIGDAAGMTAATPAAERFERLDAHLGAVVPPDELERVRAFLGELVTANEKDPDRPDFRAARAEPKLMGDQIRRAFHDWLVAQCALGPLLLVIDDLQHGDVPTVELLDEALGRHEHREWMILALGRPELVQRFGTPFGRRPITALRLGPLSKRASQKLVAEALGEDIGEELAARIVEQGAGHPGFLGELVRSVAAGRTTLPDTLLAMVHARLESLDPDARRLLRAGAVFGRRFRVAGVQHLLGGDVSEDELQTRLTELVTKDVVTRAPHADGEWAFTSEAVREASYGMLTEDDRKLGHRLAAQWLATLAAPEPAELAEHYERGGDAERAVEHYGRAARQALAANDFHGVMAWVRHAALSGAAGEALGRLRLLEAEALSWSGHYDATFRRAREAMEMLDVGSPEWFTAATEAVHAAATIADHDSVIACVEELLAAEPSDENEPMMAIALGRLVGKVLQTGRYDVGDAMAGRLERVSRDMPDPDPLVAGWLRQGRATLAQYRGDALAFLRHMEAAADAFYSIGHIRWACVQRVNVGCAHNELGQWELGELSLREALAGAEYLGLPRVVAAALQNLSQSVAHSRDVDEGIELARRALAMFEEMQEPRMLGATQTYLASMLARAGQTDEALNVAERAAATLKRADTIGARAEAVRAGVLLHLGRTEEALEVASAALSMAEQLGRVEAGDALIRLTHAEALHAAGRRADAVAALREASERLDARAQMFDDDEARTSFLGEVPENARTRALLAEWAASV